MTHHDIADRVLDTLDPAGRALLFTEARTANTFADIPVTEAEVLEAWELARWAPTSANTQPMRILLVGDDARDRLLPHMHEGNRAKTAAAPMVAVLAIDTRYHEEVPRLLPFKPELADVLEADEALRSSTGDFSAALQAGYFILAIRAVGLAAGPMGGFDRNGVDAEFLGDTTWRSTLVVNIGHPGTDPWFDRLPRLAPDEVVRRA